MNKVIKTLTRNKHNRFLIILLYLAKIVIRKMVSIMVKTLNFRNNNQLSIIIIKKIL